LVCRQAVLARRWNDQGLEAVAKRIASGQKRRPRRRAHGLDVELLEPRALSGEIVEGRRFDVRAVKADILPAQIVGDDVYDVRTRSAFLSCCQSQHHTPGCYDDHDRNSGGVLNQIYYHFLSPIGFTCQVSGFSLLPIGLSYES